MFARNPTTGGLSYVEVHKDGIGGVDGLGGAVDVAISPDGNSVYVAGFTDNALASFSRNPTTGALSYVGMQKDGVGGVDGLAGARRGAPPQTARASTSSFIDNAVAVFSRNPTTGALSFVETKKDDAAGVDGLGAAFGVTTSPDGKSVYVVASSTTPSPSSTAIRPPARSVSSRCRRTASAGLTVSSGP